MKSLLTSFFFLFLFSASAQKETFDLVSYTVPAGWKKATKENMVSFTITDNKKNTWCQLVIYKSTDSKGSITADFESEWKELVAAPFKITEAPQVDDAPESDGWKAKGGAGKFTFNNADALAMLTTMSGYDRRTSILTTTNSPGYNDAIVKFLESVKMLKPSINNSKPVTPANVIPVSNGFAFTTTNFDDGWTSTVQEDWVQTVKGNLKVLIHYPNKKADEYNSDGMFRLKNAWNILIAPRYSNAIDMLFKPVSGWEYIDYAEATMTDNATGMKVYVVFFKKHYSNGSGNYLEFICPDKASFESTFGSYDSHINSYDWKVIENMAWRNKFAVAATDLKGKWTSNFSGATQYVNASTGLDAGMDTHSSSESFEFNGSNYKWDLGVASGMVGSIKFQSAKSSGKFTMNGNWKVNFSDIEKRPRTYNAYFSCIKGLRILWLDSTAFAKIN